MSEDWKKRAEKAEERLARALDVGGALALSTAMLTSSSGAMAGRVRRAGDVASATTVETCVRSARHALDVWADFAAELEENEETR